MPYNPYLKDGKPTRQLSVVAFFDILGYKDQTREAYKNGSEECFFNKLCNALSKSYEFLTKKLNGFQEINGKEIEPLHAWKFFTDNIVIGIPIPVSFRITEQSLESLKSESVPDDVLEKLQSLKNQGITGEEHFLGILKEVIGNEQNVRFKSLILKHALDDDSWYIDSRLYNIVEPIALFQLEMVLSGFFLRGAIEIGDLYMDDKIVFGLGLLNAHKAEEKLAFYPRIILPEMTTCRVKQAIRYLDVSLSPEYLFEDADKHLVLNYLYAAFEYEKRLLFITPSRANNTDILNNGNIPNDLRQAFEKHSIVLSQNVRVSSRKTVSEWLMTDKENNQAYVVDWLRVNVVKQGKKEMLRIYEKTFGGPFEKTLFKHKKIVEEMLEKHNQDCKLLKKYVWVAKYHNDFCHKHCDERLEIDLSKYPHVDLWTIRPPYLQI